MPRTPRPVRDRHALPRPAGLRPWVTLLLMAAVLLGQLAAWRHQLSHWGDTFGGAVHAAHLLHAAQDRPGTAPGPAPGSRSLPAAPWATSEERARWGQWAQWQHWARWARVAPLQTLAAAGTATPGWHAPGEPRPSPGVPVAAHADAACTLCLAFAALASGALPAEDRLALSDRAAPAPPSPGLAAIHPRATESARIRGPPHAAA